MQRQVTRERSGCPTSDLRSERGRSARPGRASVGVQPARTGPGGYGTAHGPESERCQGTPAFGRGADSSPAPSFWFVASKDSTRRSAYRRATIGRQYRSRSSICARLRRVIAGMEERSCSAVCVLLRAASGLRRDALRGYGGLDRMDEPATCVIKRGLPEVVWVGTNKGTIVRVDQIEKGQDLPAPPKHLSRSGGCPGQGLRPAARPLTAARRRRRTGQ